jgi:guanylate kinase
MNGQGIIVIVSGPSGAGEDSIIDGLERLTPIERVITTTTRSPRQGESSGDPYYFISKEEFEIGIEAGRFFEYANHYNGNYYGVTFEEIERVRGSSSVGIWKIDYKGVETAKRLMPDIKAIYIGAPLAILEERIRRRDDVSDEYVAERMAYTEKWLERMDLYDYSVENMQGKLGESIERAKQIIDRIITTEDMIRSGAKVRVGAGGVVISPDGLIAIVSNRSISAWTLPKGGVDEDEGLESAALREVEEETGLTKLKKMGEFPPYYRLGGLHNKTLKFIHMYLYKTDERELAPTDPDNPEARWVSLTEAIEQMIHDEDKSFLCRIKKELLINGVKEQ